MKIKTLFVVALLTLTGLSLRAAEMQQIAYPTADKPSFIITVPSDWEMTQAEKEGDFFHLDGPTGALFSFRTIEGTQESLDDAIKESLKDAAEMFDDLDMGTAEDFKPDGLQGFYATGKGKDKKDGTPVRIGMAWCALNDGTIAELWFVSDLDDTKGMNAASDIANSLKSPQ